MASAARDPAMEDIADDGGLEPLQGFFALENRQRIEQSLRRMLMHSIAGVDDRDIEMHGHQVRRSRRWMPHDNAVRAHGAQRVSGIDYRFALLDTRSGGLHERGCRSQGFRGKLKGGASAGGSFIEQQHDSLAPQQRT